MTGAVDAAHGSLGALEAHPSAQGPALPGYVGREFEAYLEWGRLEYGVRLATARALARAQPGVADTSVCATPRRVRRI